MDEICLMMLNMMLGSNITTDTMNKSNSVLKKVFDRNISEIEFEKAICELSDNLKIDKEMIRQAVNNCKKELIMKEYIERMKDEKVELETKVTKLLTFMESDEFNKLDNLDKRLLRQQYAGMETYLTALQARLLREDTKRYQDDITELNKEISELKLQGKSEEEVMEIMSEKVRKLNSIGDGIIDSIKSLILSGIVFSEMNNPETSL